ncbi:MAG: phosphomannomutase/phosphoglucomutase [Bdellovibrionales bacterium]|nr:phosphomannomutase/phosphoglucomutase [Bdellovibrionales bacterium]
MSSPIHIPASIFREYDVRGIAGKDLSAPFARRLGQAYCVLAREHLGRPGAKLRVSVGRDCRLSSDEYAEALIEGLRDGGCDVVSLGICPSPLTYFSVFHLGLDGGIMVTGSHNPAEYNGFKIGIGKSTIHGDEIQALRRAMEAEPERAQARGSASTHEIIPEYVSYVAGRSRSLLGKKIVLDAGNGTAATVAPIVFEALGATIFPLFCTLDGRFPNHHPDPTEAKNLKHLIAEVKARKADFGIAFDGDADRIGLVDENGKVIYGDELMIILSRDLLRDHPGATIISEVKSSHRLYDDIRKHGGHGIMWKTGHSLIKSKMKDSGALLAGEMSGHIFFADRYFGYDDAIYAAIRFSEIAVAHAGPVSGLLRELPPSFTTPEIRVDCEERLKFDLVRKVKEALRSSSYQINDIDGVRVDFGDGWGLLRASNTQPVLVLRFEAPSEARLGELRAIIEGALREAAKALGHAPVV